MLLEDTNMRAYMSNPERWTADDLALWLATNSAVDRMAEREARKILAYTEPVVIAPSIPTRSDMRLTVYGEPSSYHHYAVAHGMLADALDRFLATT